MSYFPQDVVDQIAPLLPPEWTVLPYSDEPDVLDRPTVMVVTTEMDPSPIASQYNVTMHVYVLIPNRDDAYLNSFQVDHDVLLTLHEVLHLKAVQQGNASRSTFPGGHPCWDITITIMAPVTP